MHFNGVVFSPNISYVHSGQKNYMFFIHRVGVTVQD